MDAWGGSWGSSFGDSFSVGSGAVTTSSTPPVIAGRRKFAQVGGKIVAVSSYEEAERLISRHKKAKAKDEKKLRILVKKYEVVIPRQKAIVAKEISEIEQRIDRHWQALAELYEVIDRELSKLDEEEALMVLLQ